MSSMSTIYTLPTDLSAKIWLQVHSLHAISEYAWYLERDTGTWSISIPDWKIPVDQQWQTSKEETTQGLLQFTVAYPRQEF